jgi:hypothetical protein
LERLHDVQAAIAHVRANLDCMSYGCGGLRLIGLRLLIQQQSGRAGNEGRAE